MCNITGCFLNGNNIIEVTCNAQSSLGGHIYSCTSRNIIQYNRKFRCFRNRFIMLINTFLGRFIIIWHNRQYSVNSCKIIVFQSFYNGASIITTYPQQNRNSSVNAVDYHFFYGFLFFFSKSRCFGRSSQHTQEIRIILQEIVYHAHQRVIVNALILFERSNQCYPHSFQFSLYHEF